MTRQALCYRIETENGTGMYATSFTSEYNLYDLDGRHPGPGDDVALKWNGETMSYSEWRFGFSSIGQMRRWIYMPEAYAGMAEYDLAISVYLCDEYKIGDTQMVFRNATRVGRFSLRE